MSKSNIAIMTWFSYKNYGSALQSSAISHVIAKLGYNADLINYMPKGVIEDEQYKRLLGRVINKIKRVKNSSYSSPEQDKLFNKYIEERTSRTQLLRSYPELYELNSEYDAFVCGSDQIWSPICYDDKYFLSFVENPEKMVAYAPSIGSTYIANPTIKERMSAHISRFQHLAVREQQGADLIKSLTGQIARVVLDPTLLINAAEWDEFAAVEKTNKLADKEYILCYFLGEPDKYMDYVKRISAKMGVSYYVIPQTIKQKKSKNVVPFEVGPSEFVSLVRNAKYVCTDSFHGMAFSINYNIPFSVFKRFRDNDPKNQNSRVLNLLKILNLENRLVDYTDKTDITAMFSCDFSETNLCLSEQRINSIEYLKGALEKAVNENGSENKFSPYKITDMCCGCGACAIVCSKEAITVLRNAEGFDHYSIDENMCVRCGKCKSVCPMAKITAPDIKDSLALYSVKSTSEKILQQSSSGGAGYELAMVLLQHEYFISGCMYDSVDNSAKHIWIAPEEIDKLTLLQGSKYIQSRSADAMKYLEKVKTSEKVAFFGTPCQVAGIDKLLRKKGIRQNAVLVDLICHGVPSYHLWNKYIQEIDEKYGTGSNPSVIFRSKEREWRLLQMLLVGNGHTYRKVEYLDDFYAFFRRGLCYMEVCSDCPYRERSVADLRIGDYWGTRFEKDKQGVSMVIANTEKGRGLLQTLARTGKCSIQKQDLSEYWNVQYPYNPRRPLVRESLIRELIKDEKTVHQLRKEYCSYYDRQETVSKVYKTIKKIVRRG